MSVTPETFQQSMAPYVAVAEVAFESYIVTAVLRSALLVKVVHAGGGEGDGGGEGGEGGLGGWNCTTKELLGPWQAFRSYE